MDMPEGFRLLEAVYLDLGPDEPGDPKVIEALDLMKEMAEALEIQLHYHKNDTIQKCEDVLNKFKEWK